ncbi:hypothetical protein WR25_09646 [Diploscapter pachys]|uniref:Uncharacterized protein n=1 Tax=Diploscapter pachys TaxID=2018661 RepID=A0A2A2J4U9_9BILA|nr:hypothetical protein WR25_09646 [Diploscapter pachys]
MGLATGRNAALIVSCIVALIAVILMAIAFFSYGFREVHDTQKRGTKEYGLIRFCYVPDPPTYYNGPPMRPEDDSLKKMCHMRTYAPGVQYNIGNSRDHFGDFELATIILLVCAMVATVFGIGCSICTIFTAFGALAHSTLLLTGAVSALAGFLVYTYFSELKENQIDVVSGYQFNVYYSWAYYMTGAAAALIMSAFLISLFSSSLTLVRRGRAKHHHTKTVSTLPV